MSTKKHRDNTTAAVAGVCAIVGTVVAAALAYSLVEQQVRDSIDAPPVAVLRQGETAPHPLGYRRTLGLVLHLESERGPNATGFPVARVGPLTALLTARHVERDVAVEGYGSWTAVAQDGRRLPVVGHEHSDDCDAAVVWVRGEVETVELLGEVAVGDEVVAAGYLSPGFVVSEGMVGGESDFARTILTSALVYHGMSGGPVMLRDGRVVGVVCGYLTDDFRDLRVFGVSFFTPYHQFEAWLGEALTRVPEAPK